jgi:hypothetical protein
MRRGSIVTKVLRTVALLAVLSIVAGLLMACGEEEDVGTGTAGGSQQPTPTATPRTSPPTPTSPPSPTPAPDRIDHPTGKDELIIRISYEGGFVPPSYLLTRMPVFLLDGRGCAITQGPMIEIYPQPALPNLLETCLTEEGVQMILQAAKDAGLLGDDAHYPMDLIADATTAVFVVNADGRTIRVSAYALLESDDELLSGDDKEQQAAARAKLREFMAAVTDLRSWLPDSVFVSEEQPYEISRMQLVFIPSESASAPYVPDEFTQQEIEWPLASNLAGFGEPFLTAEQRCGVVAGEDLAQVLAQLQDANQLTLWTSGDESFYLFLRPLLPGEEGCADPVM